MNSIDSYAEWLLAGMLVFIILMILAFVKRNNAAKHDTTVDSQATDEANVSASKYKK